MRRLESGHLHGRKRLIGRGRPAIGRVCARSVAARQSLSRFQPRPALLVRGDEIDIEMQRTDAPDAVRALFISVLVNAIAPFGMLLVLAQHAVVAPPRSRTAPVLCDIYRGLERDPFVELAVDQPFLPAMEP